MTPEQTLDWLAEQHFEQCKEARPVQEWIRSMKSMLPTQGPTCPECKAVVLYECVACSSNNYPPAAQPEQPPQRPWVGLTDEEKGELWSGKNGCIPFSYADAIEARLKDKNI